MVGGNVAQATEGPATPERERQCERVVVDELQVEQPILRALPRAAGEHVEERQQNRVAEVVQCGFDGCDP